jgi:hypothetical protein
MTPTKYKTLHLGHTSDWYRKELKKKSVFVSIYADGMLEKVENTKESIDIVVMSLRGMGFTKARTPWRDIIARVKEFGDFCPAEVGPALALDGIEPGLVYLAMEPIPDRGGRPSVFYVARDGGGSLDLGSGWAGPGRDWSLVDRLVFSPINRNNRDHCKLLLEPSDSFGTNLYNGTSCRSANRQSSENILRGQKDWHGWNNRKILLTGARKEY